MRTVKLKEITLNITDGKHGDCRDSYNSEYYFISCKDIKNGKVFYEEARQITKEDFYEAHKRTNLEVNDILLTNSGTIGRMAFVEDGELAARTTFQKSVAIIKPNAELIVPKYLYYVLLNSVDTLTNHSNGSAQKNLLLSTLRDFPLKIHFYKETQDRVASILAKYDALIENNQKQIKLLEEAAQRLYKEWFVDLRFPGHEDVEFIDGLPKGWSEKLLIDVAEIQYGYSFDGKLFNSNGEGNPIVRIRNISDGVTSDFTTEEADNDYIIHNGDIIVGMDGEFHINSWCGHDAYLVQRTCSIRPYDENMKGFIFQAIYEPIKFFEATLVGATVAHLGKKHLDTIKIKIAPDKLLCPSKTMFVKSE